MASSLPLQELPLLPDVWELCLFPPRLAPGGPKLRATLLVAEVATKRMRLTFPVRANETCGAALRQALLRPDAGAVPGRPRGLRVLDPALLRELQPVLMEARVLA